MRGNGCFGFSYEQQDEIWVKWKKGDSLSDIGRALRKHPGSVHHLIVFNGGIAPSKRKRSKRIGQGSIPIKFQAKKNVEF